MSFPPFPLAWPDGDPRTILLAVVLWPLGGGMALGAAVRWCLMLRKLS